MKIKFFGGPCDGLECEIVEPALLPDEMELHTVGERGAMGHHLPGHHYRKITVTVLGESETAEFHYEPR